MGGPIEEGVGGLGWPCLWWALLTSVHVVLAALYPLPPLRYERELKSAEVAGRKKVPWRPCCG